MESFLMATGLAQCDTAALKPQFLHLIFHIKTYKMSVIPNYMEIVIHCKSEQIQKCLFEDIVTNKMLRPSKHVLFSKSSPTVGCAVLM